MAYFASEGGRPAVVLPEQVEVLAHRVSLGFCFSLFPLGPCSPEGFQKGNHVTFFGRQGTAKISHFANYSWRLLRFRTDEQNGPGGKGRRGPGLACTQSAATGARHEALEPAQRKPGDRRGIGSGFDHRMSRFAVDILKMPTELREAQVDQASEPPLGIGQFMGNET